MAEDVREELEKALKAGRDAGDTLDELADRVRRALGDAGRQRAERIARTETTGAMNAGHQAAREELADMGLAAGKEWLSIDDDDTRDDHAEAQGRQVGVDEPFTVGGEECDYPGDTKLSAGNRVNCRCVAVTVTVADRDEGGAADDAGGAGEGGE